VKLEGIHHITAITGDAPRNVDFYARVLGLRLVKRTVNQDDPTVYHLFYGDDDGSPGNDLTFFEYPGAARGEVGAGMVHRIVWRVRDADALGFWDERLRREGVEPVRDGDRLLFDDPEGLGHELAVATVPDEPLIARAAEIPDEHALQGFDAVRAYARSPEQSGALLSEGLAFEQVGPGWEARGDARGGRILYDQLDRRGTQGAGTVHHVAWASTPADHERWRERVVAAGARPTPVIDRFYFRSIYFREPSGVLFELATFSPGFAADEDPEHLGEHLVLPPWLESRRDEIERRLTPVENPRAVAR
jgi:glyoxalase family protein